ncbi:amino acid permease [Defluviitalea raffinosedens]|uniref:amino acid permease n=1 Tax=Defluviitalea raffinosedens TaxID=1450156 RepID=UPI00195CEAF9|nr:amino acid permease [Defluviitalea raffinosedens]MBM7685717.1 amino acid transporter [Defluviitalea raffinosedens]
MKDTHKEGLGTFEGVYTPTVLTILGVVMYLRMGWIVGNSGILGTLSIIILAHMIIISTTLSMSSMLTNIDIGAGGAYAIVSRSLGLEIGGAVGIPLYFSQTLSVAFYITGFTEVWTSFFDHPRWLVGLIVWGILTVLSVVSARLAFRIQYFILGAMVLSIASFILGPSLNSESPVLIGNFEQSGYWETFAIFFPAVTGILSGASMSGELKSPRKSIIRGTLAAVMTGLAVYMLFALLFATRVPEEILLSDHSIILQLGKFRILIVAGIMGAVLSSALSSLVSAPRTLAALAENRSVPFAKIFAKKTAGNEPRNAVIVSSLISLAVLLASNLDSLAAMLTLFFLTTYCTINLVVLVEQAIGVISFRPRFRISILIPVIGLVGCLLSMFLINKWFTWITFILILVIYYMLRRKNLVSPWGDVRGGVFISLAEWGAQKSMSMPYHPRLWKPSILIPVENPEDFKRISRLIRSLINPSGRVYYLTMNNVGNQRKELEEKIDAVLQPLKEENLFAQKIVINSKDYNQDLNIVLQSLVHVFLPPNTIFFTISEETEKRKKFFEMVKNLEDVRKRIGLLCLRIHPKYGFGQEKNIHLWLRSKSKNYNLAVLSAIQIMKNWNGNLTLCRVAEHASQVPNIEKELLKFIEDARLPINTKIDVKVGNFYDLIKEQSTDLNILGMSNSLGQIENIIDQVPASILFVGDSELENVLV